MGMLELKLNLVDQTMYNTKFTFERSYWKYYIGKLLTFVSCGSPAVYQTDRWETIYTCGDCQHCDGDNMFMVDGFKHWVVAQLLYATCLDPSCKMVIQGENITFTYERCD